MFKQPGKTPAVSEIQKHVSGTYFAVRLGLGLIAIAFPVVLVAVGKYYVGPELQDSISAYYHYEVNGRSMRDVFVGTLFALGALLCLYRGFTPLENRLLNLAGFLAVCVAIFPMAWPSGGGGARFSIHGASAVGAFVCLACVAWFTASNTLSLVTDPTKRARYKRGYQLLAFAMTLAPVAAYVLSVVFGARTLIAEALGLWIFSAYWFVKSFEIHETRADVHALQATLERVGTIDLPLPAALDATDN